MIDGVSLRMGGQDWIVPPLTLGQLRRLMPKVQLVSGMSAAIAASDEDLAAAVELVQAALSRNYPDVTVETVAENLLDAGNARPVMLAILFGSGLKPAGEAAPAAADPDPTGPASTGS